MRWGRTRALLLYDYLVAAMVGGSIAGLLGAGIGIAVYRRFVLRCVLLEARCDLRTHEIDVVRRIWGRIEGKPKEWMP